MIKREFQFSEGTTQKFWRIIREGATTIVEFGRIGTTGQTQTKSYADETIAQAACDKLIGEKLKKGYSEMGTAPTVAPAVGALRPESRVSKSAPVSPPKPEPIPPPTLIPTTEPMRLALDPADYLWATWRNAPAVPRPPTPPFNKEDALRRLEKVGKDTYSWNWEHASIPVAPSRQEAHFWLIAMRPTNHADKLTPGQLARQMAAHTFDGMLMPEQAAALLHGNNHTSPIEIALLAAFYTPEQLLDLLVQMVDDPNGGYYGTRREVPSLLEGFRRYVIPFLAPDERHRLSVKLTPHLANIAAPQSRYTAYPPAIYLAAMLGGQSAELRALVEQWADDRYSAEGWYDYYQRPQELIFGLDDPRLVEYHFRRLKLHLRDAKYIRAWLAHTEFAALDVARDTVLSNANKHDATLLAEALGLAIGPQLAPHMLEIMRESRAPQVARNWLEAHPAHTIVGLAPVAVGRGKLAEAAIDLLRRFARRGYVDVITATLPALGEAGMAKLRSSVLDAALEVQPPLDESAAPKELGQAFAKERTSKQMKLPLWLHPADLPTMIIGGQALTDAQTVLVLNALQRSKLTAPVPLVAALHQHAEAVSREAFAWALFEQWLVAGAPSKEIWAMLALGLLGGDTTAMRLAPLVRAWPGESQHQRAVTGLECLRAIGTDTALMQINSIAQKVKFKGLQARAGECMELIAKDRGLDRAELEDRIVPDCDLDSRGERVFDFGPRQFRFALGPGLKPMVRDEAGKFKPDLPKPSSKDDKAKATEATAAWKLLKKQVGEVAKMQALRLEQAMVTGRRWPREAFELLVVRHPLMTHLARTLIWGAYDEDGTLVVTFRVTEDQSYADSADETFNLTRFATVGVVHPLCLDQREQAAWGEVLSDYELIAPFHQLGRPVYQLEPSERETKEIVRFNHLSIPAASLVFGLDKQGWQRDAPADGGGFCGHFKPFYQANVTAVVQYEEGVGVGYIVHAPDQELKRLAFVPGICEAKMWPNYTDCLHLSTVDPVVISEVLNDLTIVMAKAQ